MSEIFDRLPLTFNNELQVTRWLAAHPEDYVGALLSLPTQVKLWVQAYGSWLFNLEISAALERGVDIPANLPLAPLSSPALQEMYTPWFRQHQITDIGQALQPFKFLQMKNRTAPTLLYPRDMSMVQVREGMVLQFRLPRAAYATTCLMHVFELWYGNPVPEWVQTSERDPKADLGQESIAPVVDRLRAYLGEPIQGESDV